MRLLGREADDWRIADAGPWLVHRLVAPSGVTVGYAVLQFHLRGIYESADLALAEIMNHPEWRVRTGFCQGESPPSDCATGDPGPYAPESSPPCAAPEPPDAATPATTSSDPP